MEGGGTYRTSYVHCWLVTLCISLRKMAENRKLEDVFSKRKHVLVMCHVQSATSIMTIEIGTSLSFVSQCCRVCEFTALLWVLLLLFLISVCYPVLEWYKFSINPLVYSVLYVWRHHVHKEQDTTAVDWIKVFADVYQNNKAVSVIPPHAVHNINQGPGPPTLFFFLSVRESSYV